MSTLKLGIYITGIVSVAVGLAMLPFHFRAGFVILVVSILILALLGWRNVALALKVGIVANDPTENIPEGEEVV